MDVIVKSFSSLMLMLFLVVLGSGILAYSIQVRSANTFAMSCAKRIEYSHYNQEIIDECKSNALKRGYNLKVVSLGNDGDEKMGILELEYESFIKNLGIEHKRTISMEV